MSIQINFKVRCETELHQQVFIAGDIQQLGQWNPYLGLKLNTNKEIYPLWVGFLHGEFEPNLLIKYKAVIIDSGHNIWESTENRALQVRYQSQSIIFSFNSSFEQMIKIQSFFDNSSDSDEEAIDFQGAKRRVFKNVICPLDFDFVNSDSEQESSQHSSIFGSRKNSYNSSLRNLDSSQNLNVLQISSFKI